MPIPASTIPAVKTYLYNQLTAALAGTADLAVFMDTPPNDPPVESDVIVVGDVELGFDPWQMVGSGGQGWLYEKYSVEILISVYRGGDHAQTVLTQATNLVYQVCDVVRLDPSLGGLVVQAYPASAHFESGWSEEGASGRVTDVEMKIAVEAGQ